MSAILARSRSRWLDHSGLLFVGFLGILLSARFEVLSHPPYWDSIVGLFAEAIWLGHNGFDFLRLAFEEPGYAWGGPRVYFFSVYPSFQALLLKVVSAPKTFFLINHLLTLTLASLTLVSFYRIVRRQFDMTLSLGGCLLLLVHPLFLSQADAINMEMPLLAATMIALDCSLHDRARTGALIALMAMYIKPVGIIGLTALFIVSVLSPEKERHTRWFVRSCFALGLALFSIQWVLRRSFRLEQVDTVVAFLRGSLKSSLIDLPDLLGLYLIFGVFAGLTVFAYVCQRTTQSKARHTESGKAGVEAGQGVPGKSDLTILVFMSCFSLFYANIVNILPRYFLYGLPCLMYGLIFVCQHVMKPRAWRLGTIGAVAVIFLANGHGVFYRQSPANDGFLLERSLEYLDDMHLNLKLARHLEAHYSDATIVTSWPIAQMLTLPELGYVTKPLRVITSDRPCLYVKTEPASSYSPSDAHTVWVYSANCFSRNNCYNPERDRLVETISYGTRRAMIFKRADQRG